MAKWPTFLEMLTIFFNELVELADHRNRARHRQLLSNKLFRKKYPGPYYALTSYIFIEPPIQ